MLSLILVVTASMWLRVTPADASREGFRVIQAEGQERCIVPITEYTAPGNENHYNRLHHHGFAIENPWVAYRVYFDQKQTVDVYVKREPRLELQDTYWYPSAEQIEANYGDDVLRVGGSIGCGSLKLWDGKRMIHFNDATSRSQRIVELGAEHVVAEMAQDELITRYSVNSDSRELHVQAFGKAPAALCTGLQRVPLKGGTNSESRVWSIRRDDGSVIIASWGTDFPVNDTVNYAKETVAMAVYIPAQYVDDIAEDKQNLVCLLQTNQSEEISEVAEVAIDGGDRKKSAAAIDKPIVEYYVTVLGITKELDQPIQDIDAFDAFLQGWNPHS